jgi:quercetin dioxygenase-like cupin family protein
MGVVHKFAAAGGAWQWDGVEVEPYALADGRSGRRQVVVGPRDGAARFAIRYFEIPPGGASALDVHAHDHGVVVLRGTGRVRLGDAVHALGVGDAVYVAPDETHRFECTGTEPLGFLCVALPRPGGA